MAARAALIRASIPSNARRRNRVLKAISSESCMLHRDFYHHLLHQGGLAAEDFRLMDIGGEKNDELAGLYRNIIEVFFRQSVKSDVFLFLIRYTGDLIGQRKPAKPLRAGDHDLDIRILLVALRVAFGDGLRRVLIDN